MTFIVRHNKQRIYLKPTYGDCLKKMQKEHTYTVDGLINGGGGLISRWAYIRNNIFIGKWMGLYLGGSLKLGDFKVGFYGTRIHNYIHNYVQVMYN